MDDSGLREVMTVPFPFIAGEAGAPPVVGAGGGEGVDSRVSKERLQGRSENSL